MNLHNIKAKLFAATMSAVIWTLPIAATAQTQIKAPKNKYKVQEDVKIGNQYSAQIDKQFPIITDADAANYIQRVGSRLVAAIPPEFQHPEFNYRFKWVNASDINAFALPGVPMYINRGLMEAARNEGELAGVMAHEISHGALRHATAQATKQGSAKNTLGTIGLILGGAILGGQTGAQLGMLGAQAWQTKYSREYESQSDILGARIMAAAGYDPRDLANMFQTIAKQGGGRGPEWLSSHPDPGNRFDKINKEATLLRVSPNPIKMTRDFERIQAKFRAMPKAKTMAEIEKDSKSSGGTNPTAGGKYSQNVPAPSGRYRAVNGGAVRFNVPDNWKDFPSGSDIMFAPEGAYGDEGITHGAMVGTYPGQGDLAQDTQDYVKGILDGNKYLQQRSQASRTTISGRSAYVVTLAGRSPVTNRTEVVTVYTMQLRNGQMIYFDMVVPENDSYSYSNTFRAILNSVRFSD
ncbi:MAG: M48 family metalloprotease [Pyrinomonadaceae bacterium]